MSELRCGLDPQRQSLDGVAYRLRQSHGEEPAAMVVYVSRGYANAGSVAVSRSAMVVGPETNEVTNDQDPERRCEQGAQTAALPAGRDVDMRTLVRRLPIEPASS